MKEYLPVLRILGRFLGIYLLLLLGYQLYLNYYAESHVVDPFTASIASQCAFIQNKIGFETQLVPSQKWEGIFYYVRKTWASVMVEGCNAVSVMILFASFIFAFYQGFKKTFLFTLVGLVILYILNVFRIVLINVIRVDHESWSKPAHDYLFPAIIYGGVVVLWLIWIKKFVLKNGNSN